MPFILQLLLALPSLIKLVIELYGMIKDLGSDEDKKEFESVKESIIANKKVTKEDKKRLENLREKLKQRKAG